MSAEIEIWPKGIGYDYLCGYNCEKYDANKDQLERVKLLVDAWKEMAWKHGFSCEPVRHFTCAESGNHHTFTFLSDSSPTTLNGRVQSIAASANVDKEPADTDVTIEILGTNLDTENDFRLIVIAHRYPTKEGSTGYKEPYP